MKLFLALKLNRLLHQPITFVSFPLSLSEGCHYTLLDLPDDLISWNSLPPPRIPLIWVKRLHFASKALHLDTLGSQDSII